MTIQIRSATKELAANGTVLTDEDDFEIVFLPPTVAQEYVLRISFKSDTSVDGAKYHLRSAGANNGELDFVNFPFTMGGGGIGPIDFGTWENRKVTAFFWITTPHLPLKRIEYAFYKEADPNG